MKRPENDFKEVLEETLYLNVLREKKDQLNIDTLFRPIHSLTISVH